MNLNSITSQKRGRVLPFALPDEKRTVELVAEAKLPTELGEFRLIGYWSLTSSEEFVGIACGRFRPDVPALARIHSQCLTGDVFVRQNATAGADTIEANEQLGLPVDMQRYEQCAEILSELGMHRVRLISNNPDKIQALKHFGLEIVERVSLPIKHHRNLKRYLKTKREEMGHLINLPEEIYERTRGCSLQAV